MLHVVALCFLNFSVSFLWRMMTGGFSPLNYVIAFLILLCFSRSVRCLRDIGPLMVVCRDSLGDKLGVLFAVLAGVRSNRRAAPNDETQRGSPHVQEYVAPFAQTRPSEHEGLPNWMVTCRFEVDSFRRGVSE